MEKRRYKEGELGKERRRGEERRSVLHIPTEK